MEIGLCGVDWIHLDQNRDWRGSCGHGNEHFGSIKGSKFLN
jgi:hypothetical protein